MKSLVKDINDILAEWDPLDVGKEISLDEYRSYIPQIIKHLENEKDLVICLESILIYSLEVGYDKCNEDHNIMVSEVAKKILNLKNQNKNKNLK